MQIILCALRSTVEELSAHGNTLTLRGKSDLVGFTIYEVKVIRALTLTFFGGGGWTSLVIEHNLKIGDQLLVENHKDDGLVFSVCHRAAHHAKPKSNLISLYSSYPLIPCTH